MTPRHTIDDFVNAFGLKQKGKEFVGPCPVCKEGEDRFHVREGQRRPDIRLPLLHRRRTGRRRQQRQTGAIAATERHYSHARNAPHATRAAQASGTAQAAAAAIGQRRYGVSLPRTPATNLYSPWCGATARTEPRRLASGRPTATDCGCQLRRRHRCRCIYCRSWSAHRARSQWWKASFVATPPKAHGRNKP